jgi:hypothetical protein
MSVSLVFRLISALRMLALFLLCPNDPEGARSANRWGSSAKDDD